MVQLLGDKDEAHMRVRFDNKDVNQDEWMPYDPTTTSAGSGEPLALRCGGNKETLAAYLKLRGQRGSFDQLLAQQAACALHKPTAHPLHAATRHTPPTTPLRAASRARRTPPSLTLRLLRV